MKQQTFNLGLCIVLGFSIVYCANPATNNNATRAKPNFVILLADDLRADAIHFFDNPDVKTPNIDKLAQEGFSFNRAYIMGSLVPAVCKPSRAMLLTGKSLFKVSGNKRELNNSFLFPELLKNAGYKTFITGKWHNNPQWIPRAFSDGKNIFIGGMSSHTNILLSDFDPEGKFPQAKRRAVKAFSSDIFADTAIEFLKSHKKDTPFLLYVAFTAPHDPRTPPEEFRKLYAPSKLRLPPNFMPQHPFNNGEMNVRDEKLAPFPRSPDVIRSHLADYFGMVSHLDACVGRILSALESAGLSDNTYIIFASDNGLALGSHGLLGKQNLYEHSVRVPLIIKGVDIPKGKSSNAMCYLFDLFPTICQLAKIEIPQSVEGISLINLIKGNSSALRDYIFCAYANVQRSITDGHWKLIRYTHINKTQLFDLSSDPYEINDLAGNTQYQDVIQKLMSELSKSQENYGDNLPLTTNKPAPIIFFPTPQSK